MATYLVTGGGGFIGSHLCDRLLAEGKRVVALDDLSSGKIANLAEARAYGHQFAFHTIDIRSGGLLAIFEQYHPEVVLHLAAQPSVAVSVQDPQRDASVNVTGLLNVLECAAATGTGKVVFAASGGTLYGEAKSLPVKESARGRGRPSSPYGITKAAGISYLEFFRLSRGLDYTALALANVYGPRQDPHGEAGVVAIFSALILSGQQPTIFGTGQDTRDYVYVDDTVHAFALAAERGSGQLVNIGTGVETSVNALFKAMASIAGFRGKPVFGPPRPGDLHRSALDNTLAAKALGWKPWTSLKVGLAATIDSFRPARTS
jgi:UDP-glucose 4-epimerase